MKTRFIAFALASTAVAAHSQTVPRGTSAVTAVSDAKQPTSTAANKIVIKDLIPKFLTFYRDASAQQISADARFALWKKEYGFAAVPPTPEGDKIARRLLDDAWPKYAGALPIIHRGAAGIEPSPMATLDRVTALLKPDRPVNLKLVVYVGGFEGNAYTMGQDGQPIVALPVEQTPAERAPMMTHEFVHAAQISMGTMTGAWVRTIGATVLSEGLAMRTTEHLFPGKPDASFIEMKSDPGWLRRAAAKRLAILRDVRSALDSSKSDDVFRYTMGIGPAGIDREAYYAGWLVVGYWLKHGMTYRDIARIPEQNAPERVGKTLDAMIGPS